MIIVPTVTILLDRERRLKMDLNAMATFEEETGKSLLSGFNAAEINMRDIRTLLWVCLRHEDPALTQENVGAMVHAGNLQLASEAIVNVFGMAMPVQEAKEEPPLAP